MEELSSFVYSDIKAELFRLKSKEMKTNCFITEQQFTEAYEANNIRFFKTERGCFLLIEDDGFVRLNFIVANIEELIPFLAYLRENRKEEISIELVGSSNYLRETKDVFLKNGFFEYSSMVRMSKIRSTIENINFENIYLLTADKSEELKLIYNKYFDKLVERVPTYKEIGSFVQRKNAYYYSDNGQIQGFVVFECYGITSHLRYWFVHPNYRDKKIGSRLLQLFFNTGENVKRELFWVINGNENAIKRYKHFGFVEEDMYNFILVNKNKKYEQPNH